jgi:hypothetical protein
MGYALGLGKRLHGKKISKPNKPNPTTPVPEFWPEEIFLP